MPLRIVFAFALATLLNQQIRGRLFYRVAYYMPSIIPGVASAVLWIILRAVPPGGTIRYNTEVARVTLDGQRATGI